jgi:hypothetical protein
MGKRTLDWYIRALRECDDRDRLQDKLKIGDNFTVFLYGAQDRLLRQALAAFKGESWNPAYEEKDNVLFEDDRLRRLLTRRDFNYRPEKISASVRRTWNLCGPTFRIKGLDMEPSVQVSFHVHHVELVGEDIERPQTHPWPLETIAKAVADFGEYIINKGLTARFWYANINYVPEKI